MNFEIPVEMFVRLAGVTMRMPVGLSEEETAPLKCVRLDRINGHVYAIGTNRKVAAIYYLGKDDGINGAVHVVVDPALIKQCEAEKPFNSVLSVTVIPALQMASLKTTFGYNYPGNGAFFPAKTPLDKWRTWAPDEIKASNGAMAWELEDMEALNRASPSGQIAFPALIDASMPVVLRDLKFDNWVGLFMPNRVDDAGRSYMVEAATLPEWWLA